MNKKEIDNIKNHNIDHDTEVIMYIIINNDLKMGKGKIAGQACHSVARIIRILENMKNTLHRNNYMNWCKNYEPKIVLKATQEQIEDLIEKYSDIKKNIWSIYTQDLGRTQIEEGSITSICFCPIKRKDRPIELKDLKLLN